VRARQDLVAAAGGRWIPEAETAMATARAGPVVVGMMLTAAERARRGSLCGASRTLWSFGYACTVVMTPCSMPKLSCRTFSSASR
jgi:hypothetical protein